jgi:hypothetical protein
MSAPWRITAVHPKHGHVLALTFADGTTKEVDMLPFLRPGGIFEPLIKDLALFRQVQVDDDSWTIVWPNGADFAPDTLYYGLKPAWMEEEEGAEAKRRAV